LTPIGYVIDGDTVGCFTKEQLQDILILIEQERECSLILSESERIISGKDSIISKNSQIITNLQMQIVNLEGIEATYKEIVKNQRGIMSMQEKRIRGLKTQRLLIGGSSAIIIGVVIIISFFGK